MAKYSAYEILEIKGSFIYFILLIIISLIAHGFQFVAKVKLVGILGPLLINLIMILLAFVIFRKKEQIKPLHTFMDSRHRHGDHTCPGQVQLRDKRGLDLRL